MTTAGLKVRADRRRRHRRRRRGALAAPSFPLILVPRVVAGIGSVGIFAEEREGSSVNIFRQVQKKKLLTTVEQAGLLT